MKNLIPKALLFCFALGVTLVAQSQWKGGDSNLPGPSPEPKPEGVAEIVVQWQRSQLSQYASIADEFANQIGNGNYTREGLFDQDAFAKDWKQQIDNARASASSDWNTALDSAKEQQDWEQSVSQFFRQSAAGFKEAAQ